MTLQENLECLQCTCITNFRGKKKKNKKKKQLKFEKVSLVSILKILKEFKTNKATGVDNLAGRFLKNSLCIKKVSKIQKFHSTETCLSYLYDKITKGFHSGLLTRMVFIDLQKAFDTIDHNILIKKMPFIGFTGTVKWYTSLK